MSRVRTFAVITGRAHISVLLLVVFLGTLSGDALHGLLGHHHHGSHSCAISMNGDTDESHHTSVQVESEGTDLQYLLNAEEDCALCDILPIQEWQRSEFDQAQSFVRGIRYFSDPGENAIDTRPKEVNDRGPPSRS